ncbi:MAG: hypothetical protein ACLFPL_02390 [Candidatus Nanoarchaeia archaeon]
MSIVLYLKYHTFMKELVAEYEHKLTTYFNNVIPTYITTTLNTTHNYLEISISQDISKAHLNEFLSYLLYYIHPFYSITNNKGEHVFQAQFSRREYFLYYEQEREKELFHIQYLIKKTLQHFEEQFKLSKKVSIIDIFSMNSTLCVESTKILEQLPHNISKRHNINISSNQPSIHLPYPKDTVQNTSNIQIKQFQVLTHHQELFKQIREEVARARIKIRPSIIETELLDVKFISNQFSYVFPSLLTPTYINSKKEILEQFSFNTSQAEFDEFIDYFLYQAEFITTFGISLLSEYKIKQLTFRKYRLKLVLCHELPHPFDTSRTCYVYVIEKKQKGK